MAFDLKILGGDITIAEDGEPESVTGYRGVIQNALDILLTPIGSIKYHPGYGTGLSFLTQEGGDDPVTIIIDVESQIYTALSNLMALQAYQQNSQILSPEEIIMEIKSVNAFIDSVDPRLINVKIFLILGDLSEVPVSLTVKIQ